MDWTVFKLLAWTEDYFKGHDIDSPRLTAEILLAFSLGVRRLDLYLQHDRPLEKEELARFKKLIRRRTSREPVAYITGEKGFYESRFQVGPGVLIPRPDTEILVETCLGLLAESNDVSEPEAGPRCVLELGVGSGAVVVSLAKVCPDVQFLASDISATALETARQNAVAAETGNILFFLGNWLAPLRPGHRFDIILSNPPYIPAGDIDGLAPEIAHHEPRTALDGGPDGLDCIREIMATASAYLRPGGFLLLEMGYDQQAGVAAIEQACTGFGSLEFIKDLAGHTRVAKLKKRN